MKILLLDTNHAVLKDKLEKSGFEVHEDFVSDYQTILTKIKSFDGVVLRSRLPINKELIVAATNLKFIARVGAGLENIDSQFAKEKNITLIASPEGNRDSLAEHTMGMLLALLNRIVVTNEEVKNGIWLREENRADELMGKTIGIIGYGNMGKAFAKRLKGFGVAVIFYDILPQLEDENAKQVTMETLFKETDVLSLHTPLTQLTHNLVNQTFIDQFEKPFYLINTARGKCVATKDLVVALKNGNIKGACLDVLEYEKSTFETLNKQELPNDFIYLTQSNKVILTPHIAGWSVQNKQKMAEIIANKITTQFG